MSETGSDFTQKRYGDEHMEATDFSRERVQCVLDWMPRDGKLLEVGVWDGTIVKNYRGHFNGQIYGTDLTLDIMREALPLLFEAKPCNLDSDALPWSDDFFDAVVCNEVIEHIFDTDRLVKELYRVLKPGGMLILSTPNLASLPNRICLMLGWQPYSTEVSSLRSNYGNPLRKSLNPAGHIRVFTFRALLEMVQTHGFVLEASRATPISTKGILKLLEKMAAMVSTSLGSDMVLKLRKPQPSGT